MKFLVFSSVSSSTFDGFSGADSVVLSDSSTGQSWSIYPQGKITPAHIFGKLSEMMQPATASEISSGALGDNFLSATITESKLIKLDLSGESMTLIFGSTAIRDQCGFSSTTTTGTTITSNTPLIALECTHISPSINVNYSGSSSHGSGSLSASKSSGEIVCVMTHANVNTLETHCKSSGYVTPADTQRNLFGWTLAVESITSEKVSATHQRITLRGAVKH